MRRPGVFLVFIGFALVATGACSRGDPSPPGDDPAPASEIFAHVSEAMTREGSVLHAVMETELDVKGSGKDRQKDEIWVDAARDVAHLRENVDPPQGEISTDVVMAGGLLLGGSRWGPAPTCHAANAAVSLVLRCDETEVVISTNVKRGRFDGRSTVIVATKGERSPGEGTLYYTRELHIDAATWLPVGEETEGVWGPLAPVKFKKVVRFTVEFVDADSLPATFFDPGVDRSVGGNFTVIELVVLPGGRFEQAEVKVPRYQMVTYRLVNRDTGVAHNLALYPAGANAASRIARTGSCEGPCTRETRPMSFDPGPQGGGYEFRCDLHPDKMKGSLDFEAPAMTAPSATNTPVPLLAGPNSIRDASAIAVPPGEVRVSFDSTYAIDPPGGTITNITVTLLGPDGRPLRSYPPAVFPVSRGTGHSSMTLGLGDQLASVTGVSICFTGPGQPDLGCAEVSLQRPLGAATSPAPTGSSTPAVQWTPPPPPLEWMPFRQPPFEGHTAPGWATFLLRGGDPATDTTLRSSLLSSVNREWLLGYVSEMKPAYQPFAFFVFLDPTSSSLSPRIAVSPCSPSGAVDARDLVDSWRRGGAVASWVEGFSANTQAGRVGLAKVTVPDGTLYTAILTSGACSRTLYFRPEAGNESSLPDLATFLSLLRFDDRDP